MIYVQQGDFMVKSEKQTVRVGKEIGGRKEVDIIIVANFDLNELSASEPIIKCVKKEMKERGVEVKSVSIKTSKLPSPSSFKQNNFPKRKKAK